MKKVFKTIVLFSIVAFFLISCGQKETFENAEQMVSAASEKAMAISPEQVKTKIDSGAFISLIDVREAPEHNAGFIPGAVNIPRGILEFQIGNEVFWDEQFMYLPEKEEEIIVFCKKGKRSILAALTLQKLGYENVRYIDGGWKAWEMSYPLLYLKNLDLQVSHGAEEGGC
jgi:rhodanese-related sulfurtransferase/predicted small lipoprotein YifL